TVSIDVLAGHFISEGADEGLAGDLAFAQSIVETGYFTFSARVLPSYNNFSGLGAVDGGTGAAAFSTAELGVRAQIQHLRAYADPTVTAGKLAHPVIDPRFSLVAPKGKAPTWEQFGNGIWATDPGYAAKVINVYDQILAYAGVSGTTPTTTPTTTPPPTTVPPPVRSFPPFSSGTAAVNQAYADILGRTPTTSELASGTSALNTGATTPSQLIAGLVAGEGADDAQPVARLYLAGLGRLPDRSGLQYWTRRHAAGVPLSDLAQQFLVSSEFNRRYGSPGNAAYIDVLYRNVLGRAADADGLDYWNRRLVAGKITRSGLDVQFSESSENRTKTAAKVEASVVYVGMVLRAPDPSVLSWWTTKKTAGSPLSTLTDLVFESSAYQNRF
ncbi:MAG: Mannosyl-glycoprotein endo-beta-N-acetylglucosaminidase, partial [Ilumatobacteraceae bacterium]|nr:Mannosyl-glycoprotein endo-beta-N-acetylglucosaminidase [Ilumatobacteraceae bacterium]